MIQKPRWTPDISVGSVCIVVTVALTIGGGLFGACWELSGQLSGINGRLARNGQFIAELKDAVTDMRNDNRDLAAAQKQVLASLRAAIDRFTASGRR